MSYLYTTHITDTFGLVDCHTRVYLHITDRFGPVVDCHTYRQLTSQRYLALLSTAIRIFIYTTHITDSFDCMSTIILIYNSHHRHIWPCCPLSYLYTTQITDTFGPVVQKL